VAFDIDANGILHVSAKDKGTGKEQKIRIEASSGLTEEEIDKMKKEAEANAEVDKQAKERVDKLNAADSLIFQTEKQLSEYGDKLSEGNKQPIEEALTSLKSAHEAQDLSAIDSAMEGLNKAWEGATQEMYAASQEGAAAGPEANADVGADGGGDDNVSDVEFEEVEDKDK
jgi:molecular chaperone DnaK